MLGLIFLAVIVLLCFPAAALAQESRATLSGSITDESGAAMPGVSVTVLETRTGTKSETVSDSSGQYAVPFLAPGEYEVHARLQGFKEFSRTAVHVSGGDCLTIDVRLEVGSVALPSDKLWVKEVPVIPLRKIMLALIFLIFSSVLSGESLGAARAEIPS